MLSPDIGVLEDDDMLMTKVCLALVLLSATRAGSVRREINLNILLPAILLSQLLGPCLVDAEHAGSEAEYIGEEVRGTEILFLLTYFRIF